MGLFSNFFSDLFPDKQAIRHEEERIKTKFRYFQAKGHMAAADWWDNMNEKMRQMQIKSDREWYAMVEKRTAHAWHKTRQHQRSLQTANQISTSCYLPPHKEEIKGMYYKKGQKLNLLTPTDLMLPRPALFSLTTP